MPLFLQALETKAERDKFTTLYYTYRGLMFYIADKILHNEHDAEDAVQQSFLYLVKHFHKISQVDSPKTRAYIAVVAEHAAIDRLRARERRAGLPFDEMKNGVEPSFPIDHPLGEALGRLPEHYREALLLRYYCGYGVGEAADMFGVSYDAARKRIARAKKALYVLLKEEEENVRHDPVR